MYYIGTLFFYLLRNKHLKALPAIIAIIFFHIIWVVWHYNTIWWPKSSKYLYVLINILSFERRSWKKNCHRFNFIVFFCIISYDYMVINMKIFGLVNNSRESSIYFSLLKATIQEMLQSLILFSIYVYIGHQFFAVWSISRITSSVNRFSNFVLYLVRKCIFLTWYSQ